ncbi:CD3072 family TudS-related putative desulfidase [Bacteroidota bacterium]
MEIFKDKRSKSIILIAHCIINQNAKSNGTASYGGTITEIMELINKTDLGIVQMPCPELHCLGLDRSDINGSTRPVIEENSRIRNEMKQVQSLEKINTLIHALVYQIEEYLKNGFEIKGIIGINRSPSCGVDTTSKGNKEINGQGVFIKELQKDLANKNIQIPFVGIKVFEPENALSIVKKMFGLN